MFIALVIGYVLAAAAAVVACRMRKFGLRWQRRCEQLLSEVRETRTRDARTIRDLRGENDRLKRGWRKVGRG